MSIIILWSVPRSRSTVFERVMHERGDFTCLHEPYSHVSDFGTVDVLGFTCRSQTEVSNVLAHAHEGRNLFVKDTTDFSMRGALGHHALVDVAEHAVMWRAPDATIASHLRLAPNAGVDDIGYGHMRDLVDALVQAGKAPVPIEGDSFAANPKQEYERFCSAMNISAIGNPGEFSMSPPESWERTARWHVDAAVRDRVEAPRLVTKDETMSRHASELIDAVSADYVYLAKYREAFVGAAR